MVIRSLVHTALFSFFLSAAAAQTVTGPEVVFHTNLGDINVTLRPDAAPQTVANFLNYVNSGAYSNSIVHRSVVGFVWQGGGYQLINSVPTAITQNATVPNEFKLSNLRGTIAMAKLGTSPDSATDEWFFNEANNSANLDHQNGGFTVFGQVADSASLSVMDKISAVNTYDASTILSNADFTTLPLYQYNNSGTIADSNYILVSSVGQVQTVPTITGLVSASAFGGFTAAAPGSYVEIYGSYLAGTSRGWGASDFSGVLAPTALDGVSVTVNGVPAYVNYVSPGQIDIQIPDSVATGTAAVVVSYQGQASAAGNINVLSQEPGLLAPASFKVGGRQYVAAVHAATGAFVSNGNIPGVPAAPAAPGETLIFYGTGFGPVTGTTVAGQIAQGQTALANAFTMNIGNSPAKVTYQGLAPGLVGVYQFNVVMPATLSTGDLPVQITLNNFFGSQSLYLSIKN